MKIKICLVLVCVFVCFIITGCKSSQIKFVTESKFQKVMDNVTNNSQKNRVYKSQGVVIYKTTSDNKETDNSMNFGPKDPTFNLPSNF